LRDDSLRGAQARQVALDGIEEAHLRLAPPLPLFVDPAEIAEYVLSSSRRRIGLPSQETIRSPGRAAPSCAACTNRSPRQASFGGPDCIHATIPETAWPLSLPLSRGSMQGSGPRSVGFQHLIRRKRPSVSKSVFEKMFYLQ
jgi:hypothetical protein